MVVLQRLFRGAKDRQVDSIMPRAERGLKQPSPDSVSHYHIRLCPQAAPSGTLFIAPSE